MAEGRVIVTRVESGMDRKDIYASTYQMRNCFHSFADAFASELDVFCYFQHAFSADLCPQGGRVLDMCCGRGLLIPFLRYRNRQATLYVGVDLHPQNAQWKDGYDPRRRGKEKKETGWDFETIFVEASVGEMLEPLREALPGLGPVFDLIAFTSSIEHMQPEVQQAALLQAKEVAHGKTILYLTCPVTPENRDGYDCQYKAHIYEPKESELLGWLDAAGWQVDRSWGLVTKVGEIKDRLTLEELATAKDLLSRMPRELALPVIASLFSDCATEKAYLCSLKSGHGRRDIPPRSAKVETPKPGEGLLAMMGIED